MGREAGGSREEAGTEVWPRIRGGYPRGLGTSHQGLQAGGQDPLEGNLGRDSARRANRHPETCP